MNHEASETTRDLAGERLIRANEFRALLGGVSNMFLYRRESDDPAFPKAIKIGSNRFWRVADVLSYLAAKRTHVSDQTQPHRPSAA